MSITADVSCVWKVGAILGESPCWDRRQDALVWVDIKGHRLHAFGIEDRRTRTWAPPTRICSLGVPPSSWTPPPVDAHWFLGCTENGFGWIGAAAGEVIEHPLAHPEPDKPGNRFNDGKMGPDGRYWAGTMDDAEINATGSLYAFQETGAFERIDTGYVVSNGPAFSPDRRTLYHTDSARRVIYAFDLSAAGAVTNRRIFVEFSDRDGYPDGMTTDRAGNLWVAMWDGARIEKLSPGGERLGHISMPVTRPTSCAFANAEESVLYVTSAAIGAQADDALAGGLFRVDLR
ncbi:MAG: SMP-30/gluconolactonase/LRE family protein [Hyphomonadaceae bacterium]